MWFMSGGKGRHYAPLELEKNPTGASSLLSGGGRLPCCLLSASNSNKGKLLGWEHAPHRHVVTPCMPGVVAPKEVPTVLMVLC